MKLPRHAEIWFQPYVADRAGRLLRTSSCPLRHVWLTVADHFEPFVGRVEFETARQRVHTWSRRWREISSSITPDHSNSPPVHTFFYPVEQYHPELLDALAELTRDGIADVEVHIHHDGEGRGHFSQQVAEFCQLLIERHGLLRTVDSQPRFGFIHGNWALDNSLPGGRWCGLNDEITLLRDLGCYADFTMPSGASPSQARMLNTIYWCTDEPDLPKSYDAGTPVLPGARVSGDLLIIPGPFGLRWRQRLLPRMETGELAPYDPASVYRVRKWFELAPRLGEHLFLKLYTHGALPSNSEFLLDRGLFDVFELIHREAQRLSVSVHYASAWQMYLAADAINNGNNPERTLAERTGSLHVR